MTSSSFSRRLAAGAVAGAAGTLAMDALLYRRSRLAGGEEPFLDWETAAGVSDWDGASAPGQVGRKAARAVLGHDPPDGWARATTNVVHWATGIGWGVQYGAVAARTARHPILRALALGPAVWLAGYVILPLAKVYRPIWEYDGRTLADDLSAHLVYGAVGSVAFAALGGSGS